MIILIRHGEATHHTENLTGGWTDSTLTAAGEAQMKTLGAKLAKDFAGRSLPLIYASDLQRAMTSAQLIADALGCNRIYLREYLREKNNGKAAGLTEQEAKQFFHKPSSEKDLDHANYDGGETRRQFYERTVAGLEELQSKKDNIIVVAHKGTIQNIIFAWLGLDIEEVNAKNLSVDVRAASVSLLGVNKWQEHALFLLNETNYLSEAQAGLGVFNYKFTNA